MVMMVIVMEDESNIHERLGWSIMAMTLSYTIDDNDDGYKYKVV